jgi:hypothetical protein
MLRASAGLALAFTLSSAAVFADSGIRINAQGPFSDVGVWMYRNDDNKVRNDVGVRGTNESLIMPSPSPQYGETLVGITHIHHERDTMGYPVHISPIEKAFANLYKVQFFSSGGTMLWRYDAGNPFFRETGSATSPARADPLQNFTLIGPIAGNEAVPPRYQDAVAYLKRALDSIENQHPLKKTFHTMSCFLSRRTTPSGWKLLPIRRGGRACILGARCRTVAIWFSPTLKISQQASMEARGFSVFRLGVLWRLAQSRSV